MNPKPSNSLRDELARSQQPTVHPDAGLLTAFSENSLLQRERQEVSEHLAICSECRDVVHTATSAAPEAESPTVMQLPVPPVRPPLRSWLPWVAVAACVAIIVPTVMLLRREVNPAHPAPQVAANVTPEAPAVPEAPEQKELPAAPPAIKTTPVRRDRSLTTPRAKTPAPPPASEASTSIAQLNTQAADQVQSQQTAAYRPSQQARSQGPSQQTENNQMNANGFANAPLAQKAAPFAAAGAAQASPVTSFADAALAPSTTEVRARWRISRSGHVERAFGDNLWQTVLAGATFRVLSVSGNAVWAGGDQLKLFRSGDDGNSWTPVTLPARGDRKPAVAHIQIQSAQIITIEADDGTTWTTTDGGKSWQ